MKLNLTRLWIVWALISLLGGLGTYTLGHWFLTEQRAEALYWNTELGQTRVVTFREADLLRGIGFQVRVHPLGDPRGDPRGNAIIQRYDRWTRRLPVAVGGLTLLLMLAPVGGRGVWRWAHS